MNELFEIYEKYKAHSDKGTKHSFINFYEGLFLPYKNKEINLLEIGVQRGASLNLWNDYFVNAKSITGMDIDASSILDEEREKWTDKICLIEGDSTSSETLLKFDIIIDDGDHSYRTQIRTFENLYHKLKIGGVYVVEDVSKESMWRFAKYYKDLGPACLDFREHRREELGRHCEHNQLVVFFKDKEWNPRSGD
tara:strand:- start:70 stop:651 length:582 start_codon:yes stop_codon:yes gene_type:complete